MKERPTKTVQHHMTIDIPWAKIDVFKINVRVVFYTKFSIPYTVCSLHGAHISYTLYEYTIRINLLRKRVKNIFIYTFMKFSLYVNNMERMYGNVIEEAPASLLSSLQQPPPLWQLNRRTSTCNSERKKSKRGKKRVNFWLGKLAAGGEDTGQITT